jgi:rhodanese-related sulfurtransferase
MPIGGKIEKNKTDYLIPVAGFSDLLATSAADQVPFTDITPTQAAALIKEKSADPLFKILDVRTPEEFALNYIKGALNIDVKALDFKEKIEKLDKNSTYLAYCKGGVRSAMAMNLMKEQGFKQVYNLGGGLMKWQEEKQPLEGAPIPADPPATPR